MAGDLFSRVRRPHTFPSIVTIATADTTTATTDVHKNEEKN